MLHARGPDMFHQLTLEDASVVLQPEFIAQQNIRLGYGPSTEAVWLGSRRMIELATIDNPDGPGVAPWWVVCQAYDNFVDGLQSALASPDDFRRGGLEIRIVNTDNACQGGRHWFVVAWYIEPAPPPAGDALEADEIRAALEASMC